MNISNINVNKYPVSQVFDPASRVVFEIPKYQREYTWGSNQWEALFDDLIENDNGYFLGSIICINSSTDAITSPKFEVVDGQQRLTTLSLFLAALYTTLNSYKELLDEDQQSDILQLKRKLVLKNTQDVIRVVPQVQGSNRDDYMGLLAKSGIIPKRPMPKFAGLRRIEKAYNYFKKRITAVIDDESEKIHAMFKIIDKVNSAIIVMIEVSNHSDAYTLFESLNNRGTPLTSIDLIKNLLLARLDVSGDGDIDYYFSDGQRYFQISVRNTLIRRDFSDKTTMLLENRSMRLFLKVIVSIHLVLLQHAPLCLTFMKKSLLKTPFPRLMNSLKTLQSMQVLY